MRRLIIFLIVLAVIVGGLSIADIIVRHRVQSAVASRIESRSPGSHATVKISSFPFTGRLAVSGDVPELEANVTNVRSGDLTFSRIRLTLDNLKVDRDDLFHGTVKPLSIRRGRVVADISEASVDALVKLPIRLSPGRVSAAGVNAPVHLSVSDGRVTFEAAGLPSLSIDVPVLDVLPCVESARVVTGAVRLSCRFRQLPPLLSDTTIGI